VNKRGAAMPNALKEADTLLPDDLADWVSKLSEVLTPLDWAEQALDYAQVKHSRRPFLRPHLARAITEAQEAAVKRASRPKPEPPAERGDA
jgi:hypothetical protein